MSRRLLLRNAGTKFGNPAKKFLSRRIHFLNGPEQLLPLSSGKEFLKATGEWRITGRCRSDDDCAYTCDLCRYEGLRYQFQILNRRTFNTLWLGLECIKGYSIAPCKDHEVKLDVIANGGLVGADIEQLEPAYRKRAIVLALVELSFQDEAFNIEDFLNSFCNRGTFTPRQLSLVLWRLEEYEISHDVTHFNVSTEREEEKRQLLEMVLWRLETIWPALSPSQRRWCLDNRRDINEFE